MNLSHLVLILIVVFLALSLSAAERNWDYEIEVDSQVRGELISKEQSLKDNRSVISQQTNDLKGLRDELEKALDAEDEAKLQNVLSVMVPQLVQMQERLETQDIKTEQYRVYLFRALENAERKQRHFKQDPLDSELLAMSSSIYETMSKADKQSMGAPIAKILEARKELERISKINDKLPTSPYGSVRGLSVKHELATLDRLHLNLMKEQYVQLMQIVIGIMEIYTDRELLGEVIDKADTSQFLQSFDYIINDLREAEEVGNPYIEVGADD